MEIIQKMVDAKLLLEYRYNRNTRTITDDQFNDLCNNLLSYGFLSPLIVDKTTDEVIGGNQRLKAVLHLQTQGHKQFEKVPVFYVDPANEQDRSKISFLLNNHHGEYNWDGLGEIIIDLKINIDDLPTLGFDPGDLEMNLDISDLDGGNDKDADEIPEVDKRPVVQDGELWILGKHRLLCGDCTIESNVERLMDGKKSELLFTSPPYSDQRTYNDDKDLGIDKLKQFISCFYPYANYQIINLGMQRKNNEVYPYWNEYIEYARETGYLFTSWNVWNRNIACTIAQQSALFAIYHEWLFVFAKKPDKLNRTEKKSESSKERRKYDKIDKNGNHLKKMRQKDGSMKWVSSGNDYERKNMGTVFTLYPAMDRPKEFDHPARFPVELPEKYIEAMTNQNDNIIDPFLGSGTTLIACEKTNRVCYGMEIDTWYCTVILQRYKDYTGIDPVRDDGITFTEVKNESSSNYTN